MMRSNLIALAAVPGLALAARAQNTVVNGDFETGDFAGWSSFGDQSYTGVDDLSPHTGTYGAYFGPLTPGGIEQAITAAAGSRATVTFWLWVEQNVNTFQAEFDGRTLITLNDISEPYTQYQFNVTLTNANPVLRFTF